MTDACSIAADTPAGNRLLRCVCSWCGGVTGAKMTDGPGGVSHGICRKCNRKMLHDIDAAMREKGE